MGERRGTKALELWCRRITDGYTGVKVENMTTSWRDGLAFCAIIHHFRPDLIDFNSLRAHDVFRNNALAFQTAEQCLGIPALLDAEDMVAYEVPDRLSILTYLSQFYQYFTHQGSPGGRTSLKRASVSSTATSVPESPPPAKVPAGVGRRLEPCAKCGHPVFLAERLVIPVVSSSTGPRTILYHRGCFTCARCEAKLSLANCYETIDGVWCCETCPDELDTTNSSPPPLPLSSPPAPTMTSPLVPNISTTLTTSNNSIISMDSIDTDNRDKNISENVVTANSESTKDDSDYNNDLDEDEDGSGSLVQRRMRIFEKQQILISAKPLPFVKKPDNVHTNIDPGGEVDKDPEQLINRKLEENDRKNVEAEQKIKENSDDETVKENESSSVVMDSGECQLKEENIIEPSEMDIKEVKTDFIETKEEKSDYIKTEENIIIVEEEKSVPTESIDLETKNEDINQEQVNESSNVPKESIISKGTTTNESDYPEDLNPFGSEDEEIEVKSPTIVKSPESIKSPPPRPPPPNLSKKIVPAPKVNLNPFWSDDEGPSSEEEITETSKPPIPKPRTLKSQANIPEPSPAPRRSVPAPSTLSPMSMYGSVSSLSSLASSSGGGGSTARRKKKPAPAPPSVRELFPEQKTPASADSSRTSSPTPTNLSGGASPKTMRRRKSRQAPLPPMHMSPDQQNMPPNQSSSEKLSWERQKIDKDQANRDRQSHSEAALHEHASISTPDKSTFGQWKRKKGPAPPRPVPQRREIRAMPMKEIRQELEDIEVQQQELERQGVHLEQTIRAKFEETNLSEDDSIMTPDVEDLVLHLFELVNEKNELFRKQAELMYLRRQQRLEEEHAEIEYQIRLLLEKPEHSKTDSEKACEEELIQRLVDVVERRNEIIECLDMDRKREADEDRSIHSRLEQFGSLAKTQCHDIHEERKDKSNKSSPNSGSKKKEKKFFAKKEKKLKKEKEKDKTVVDSDKDIDELEPVEVVIKGKSKKKWF